MAKKDIDKDKYLNGLIYQYEKNTLACYQANILYADIKPTNQLTQCRRENGAFPLAMLG